MSKDDADKRRAVAFKTTDIFSGITGKRLVLKDAKTPSTDGKNIGIPFQSPMYYQDLEHELAHILFESDPLAHGLFVNEYTERIGKILKKQGHEVNDTKMALFRHGLSRIIGITEDHRVNSLWGLLYPGSFDIIKEQDKELTKDLVPIAHEGVCKLFMTLEGGWDPGFGKLERFIPFLKEALDKVERRGFEATLMVSKWLVANLVSELIRENQGEPTPKQDNKGKDKDKDGDQSGGGLWTPPKVDASPQERADALKQLIDSLGELPGNLAAKINDVKEPELKERGAVKKATKIVADALKLDIHDDADVAMCLGDSADSMSDVIENAKKALGKGGLSKDGWLRKDMGAKVVFMDVREKDVEGDAEPLLAEDGTSVKRLRAVFNRVMGRRKYVLEQRGVEPDISAYIERLATNHPVPCFKQESRGRGFQTLILVDRSGSMYGEKKEQSERAFRILSRALKYPFVDLHIWGWNAQEAGQISISRFDPKLEVFDSAKSRVSGSTPLHLAVRVGARFMELGSEAKYMIVTTDGEPNFTSQDGQWYSGEALALMTKDEVQQARKHGVNVTGVIIGDAINDKKMSNMFGRKHWRRMSEDRFGDDLVKLVATSFMDYLKRG